MYGALGLRGLEIRCLKIPAADCKAGFAAPQGFITLNPQEALSL